MSRRKRRKATQPAPTAPATNTPSTGRWRFFVWMSCFFFVAGLLVQLDVMTAWPGAEGFSLAQAVGVDYGRYLPAAFNHMLLGLGDGVSEARNADFLFPRLVSALCLILTTIFTYRWMTQLFGRQVSQLTLLCAGASFFLPFFGKVATADALALLGHSGMFWTVLLFGLTKDRRKLFPFGAFALLGAIAAPVSTLLLALMLVILAVFQRMDYGWQVPAGIAVGISCLVLLVQGPQGANTYWYYGQEDSRLLDLLYYGLLGMLPLAGWLVAGVRDLAFKAQKFEQFSLIVGMALVGTLLAQSLLFMLLLALVAGKQMQLYFDGENYPWKDYVKTASVLHLILAFGAAFLLLAGGGIAFPGAGFRAALGMAAAYWIFSLLSTLGVFGERRDFAIGGSILAGLLTIMFFWVQVYPYLEAERSWPRQLLKEASLAPGSLQLPDEADDSELSSALPYFQQAGWQLREAGTYELYRYELTDSTQAAAGTQVRGRMIVRPSGFGLRAVK
ncbi:hypothetical protein LEM8419_02454 [Neolewinella maritima]|uniref:Glycosyltransferase RgtA/B/C/D-like domain-containing protein n=1 Tax=Neolewinella maritima TaxID=1383882 RepID=A0ABM9B3R1_9BACT|nr:hypothetical protein [Neolewinella maritima]CAH1001551.1 hypothetical protein LEM8419_02454 [Neolewinella maritima]